MILLIAFIAVGGAVYLSNPGNPSLASSAAGKIVKIVLAAWIGLGVILNILSGVIPAISSYLTLGFTAASVIMMIITSVVIKTQIINMKEEVKDIYPSMSVLMKVNGIRNIDEFESFFNESSDNIVIEKDHNKKISKVTVIIKSIENLSEPMVSKTVDMFEKFYSQPEKKWSGSVKFKERKVEFKIERSIPGLASYPGVDFRAPGYIEVGISGIGAACWNIGAEGEIGMSSYFYKDGEQAKTVKVGSAPHCLVVGSSGGGKSIYTSQLVTIISRNKKGV